MVIIVRKTEAGERLYETCRIKPKNRHGAVKYTEYEWSWGGSPKSTSRLFADYLRFANTVDHWEGIQSLELYDWDEVVLVATRNRWLTGGWYWSPPSSHREITQGEAEGVLKELGGKHVLDRKLRFTVTLNAYRRRAATNENCLRAQV